MININIYPKIKNIKIKSYYLFKNNDINFLK